jgi:hypothetical protein
MDAEVKQFSWTSPRSTTAVPADSVCPPTGEAGGEPAKVGGGESALLLTI